MLALLFLCAAPAEDPGAPASAPGTIPQPVGPAWPEGTLGLQLGRDLQRVFTRPFRMRGRDGSLPAALAGGAGLLYALRRDVREEIQNHRSSGRDQFLQDMRITGKGAFVPALAGILAGVGTWRGSVREKQTSLLLIESFAASAVYAAVGSTLLAAERPEEGDSVRFADTGGRGVSLDVSLSASMIAPLDRAYFRAREGESRGRRCTRRAGRGLLYLAPALVAWQRLNQDKHWVPDVYLGYANGLLVGRTLASGYTPVNSRPYRVDLSAGRLRIRF